MATWSCGNEPASDNEAAPEAEAPAPDDAPAEPEAAPAPQPRTEGTTIVEPGTKGPATISWSPAVGSTERLIVSLRVNQRLGDKPSKLQPRVRLVLDTTVASSSGDQWRRTFRIAEASVLPEAKVAEEARAALEPFVGTWVGHDGHVSIDTAGHAQDFAFDLPAPTDPHQVALVSAFELVMREQLVAIAPEAIGDGGAWEVSRRATIAGVQSWRVDRIGLRKRHGDQLELRGDLSIPDEEISGAWIGFEGVGTPSHMSAKGEVDGRFDQVRACPIEMHFTLAVDFTAPDSSGADVTGRLGIDATIDEDYLSLRDARVTLRGEFEQGGLVVGAVAPGTKVWFRGKRVRVSDTGDFLLGFGRDANRRGTLSFGFAGKPAERHVVHIASREYETERIDELDEEDVHPDSDTKKELAKSRKRINKIRNKTTKATYFRDGWVMPVKGKITSTYGRKRILNGEERGFHWGVDIATPVGKKIKAPAPGIVVFAEADIPLSGTLLIIDHGQGLTSSFLHLNKIKVKVGDEVAKGQVIAEAGKTGRVTGPHLDWRMNLHDTRIDPMLVMKL